MRNIKIVLEYDGTDFVGWQFQTNGRSVQQEVARALAQILQEEVNVIGAGRTDSGVHARGQVANFRTSSSLPASTIRDGLNGVLPEDVCVHAVEDVPEDFHARYSAKERAYSYRVALRPSAIDRRFSWQVKYVLDVDLMIEGADGVVGDHDFQSFCRAVADVAHYRCIVTQSRWCAIPGGLIYEIRANRFLHGMVRALVGTMVDIGRGYTPPDALGRIMEARDRREAGMAAPPQGLVLEEVMY